jgi:hypothetical protein
MSNGNLLSPLFWVCKCNDHYVHFTDDDTCIQCGMTERTSSFADVEAIRIWFPFIPLEMIPQEIEDGIVFAGSDTVHPLSETGTCSAVEDAFFEIRTLIRMHAKE